MLPEWSVTSPTPRSVRRSSGLSGPTLVNTSIAVLKAAVMPERRKRQANERQAERLEHVGRHCCPLCWLRLGFLPSAHQANGIGDLAEREAVALNSVPEALAAGPSSGASPG